MPLKPNKISLSEAIPFQDFGEIARAYLQKIRDLEWDYSGPLFGLQKLDKE